MVVLDETVLPFEERYIEVRTLEEALSVLGSMKTRALGQVLLFFYSCALFQDEFSIDDMVGKFKTVRPTFDFPLLGALLEESLKKEKDVRTAVARFMDDWDSSIRGTAKLLAALLPDPANILTLCNVNGALVVIYDELTQIGKQALFYVCETRPYLQGTRLTFWELCRNKIPCRLLCMNQTAQLMRQNKINAIVSGADRATMTGAIINKVGTYALARLGRYFNIPFYPLTYYPKDMDVETIEIEERPAEEVFMFLKGDFNDIDAIYPSFDITRSEFVTRPMVVMPSTGSSSKGETR
jgi:methylthioribose-1-phosphate isomerase